MRWSRGHIWAKSGGDYDGLRTIGHKLTVGTMQPTPSLSRVEPGHLIAVFRLSSRIFAKGLSQGATWQAAHRAGSHYSYRFRDSMVRPCSIVIAVRITKARAVGLDGSPAPATESGDSSSLLEWLR